MSVAFPSLNGTGLPAVMPSIMNCTAPPGPPKLAPMAETVATTESSVAVPTVAGPCNVVMVRYSWRQHLDHAHHSHIFVLKNVAVIEKRPHDVGIAKIHAQLHAGIRTRAIPIRQIDRVAQCAVIHRLAIDLQHAEVDLVNVEDVIFLRPILNRPILHRALCTTMFGG